MSAKLEILTLSLSFRHNLHTINDNILVETTQLKSFSAFEILRIFLRYLSINDGIVSRANASKRLGGSKKTSKLLLEKLVPDSM